MKHYTTIEQSKKLLKLGLNPESADMHYLFENYITQPIIKIEVGYNKDEEEACLEDDFASEYIPCWSLGALLEVMPEHIFSEDRIKNYTPVLHIGEKNVVWYQHMNEFLHIEHADTPIEAAYSTVVWLLENGYIKKEPKISSE